MLGMIKWIFIVLSVVSLIGYFFTKDPISWGAFALNLILSTIHWRADEIMEELKKKETANE